MKPVSVDAIPQVGDNQRNWICYGISFLTLHVSKSLKNSEYNGKRFQRPGISGHTGEP
jgi:hypothetical protein